MIFGIGCDMCAVARMQKAIEKSSGAHFVQRVFSVEECAQFDIVDKSGRTPLVPKTIESLAANFAAKEAFLKATGKGLSGFVLTEISALRKESGAPYYAFTGSAAAYMARHKLTAHLSLTHEKGTAGIAMAYCILECNE